VLSSDKFTIPEGVEKASVCKKMKKSSSRQKKLRSR